MLWKPAETAAAVIACIPIKSMYCSMERIDAFLLNKTGAAIKQHWCLECMHHKYQKPGDFTAWGNLPSVVTIKLPLIVLLLFLLPSSYVRLILRHSIRWQEIRSLRLALFCKIEQYKVFWSRVIIYHNHFYKPAGCCWFKNKMQRHTSIFSPLILQAIIICKLC